VATCHLDRLWAYQLAFDASPTGILVVSPEGTIALVNRELERQFGYTRDELVGEPVDRLVPDARRSLHEVHRADFARAPESRPMGSGREFAGRRKDGSEVPVQVGLRPIQTAGGIFVLVSVVEVTTRCQLESAPRQVLAGQLAFERFVADLSSRFINIPADQIHCAIEYGLDRACELLGIDRSIFIRIGPEQVLFDPVTWAVPGIPPIEPPTCAKRFPWTLERLLADEVVSFSTPAEIPNEIDRSAYLAIGTRSALIVPLSVEGRLAGVVGFEAVRAEQPWTAPAEHRLRIIGSAFSQLLARLQREEALQAATREAQRLKDELQAENTYLRSEVRQRTGPGVVVGQSEALRRVLNQIQQVAPTDATVLLLGETGTGKELFATLIHELGTRHSRTMVRVNCAAIPATLIESELFGREKGAFTGALARQAGRFELADRSTILLDEIGDLPSGVQVKLLRVLEEKQIERLGSPQPIRVDTRIIAATHCNLEQRVAEGAFREDLYYRLNVFPIHVPPLRERLEDIPPLVWRFVDEFSKTFGKRIESLDRDSLAALQRYSWPGNIRELRNTVERAMIVAKGRRLVIAPPQASAAAIRRSHKLVDIEKEHIRGVLESTHWRIRGAGGAADRLGLKPTTLETRMIKLGLKRPAHT
jgi:PAS domain S-box-containing protein